mmetsp:Transcript_24051/g.56978  ORF Transcript_24051/g.56978 Transcript_24051/m.56978 type:complete len:283 (+) Transcript_24051:53-901(+)
MSGNSRAAGGLGDQDPDLLLLISSYLDARDLARLSLTGRRTLVRIADEAARHAVESRAPGLFPKYDDETWTLTLHHHELLGRPLRLDTLVGRDVRHVRRDGAAISVSTDQYMTGVSDAVMRVGRHLAYFKRSGGNNVYLGVTRPLKGLGRLGFDNYMPFHQSHQTELLNQFDPVRWQYNNVHSCMLSCFYASCCWGDLDSNYGDAFVDGGEELQLDDGTEPIGLLLDLDEGSLTALKGGRRVGTLKHGLGGDYVWVVSLRCSTESTSCTVSIEKGDVAELQA